MSDAHDVDAAIPRLLVTPCRPAIAGGGPGTVDLLVRVQAPDAPPAGAARRPGFDLALVLDRSGSMHGQPLEEAKRCAALVVDGLTSSDRLALVAYDHEARVLVPSQPVVDREAFHGALRRLGSRGQTDLHAGWQAGAAEVAPHARRDRLARVILLSDGQANRGLTDAAALAAACAAMAARGVTTSTYGLGAGFNEDLMTAMARAGGGEAWYGETVADLREPFRAELDLLHATYATDVRLEATPRPGVEVTLRNAYPSAGPYVHRLPSLAYGAEAWAVLRVRTPQVDTATIVVTDIVVRWTDVAGRPYELRVPTLRLPIVSPAEWATLPEDDLVVRRLAELEAAGLQERARAAAEAGDWGAVDVALQEAVALGARSAWVADVATTLEELARSRETLRFLKEATFASHRMRNRRAAKDEGSEVADAGPAWLRRRVRQGRT